MREVGNSAQSRKARNGHICPNIPTLLARNCRKRGASSTATLTICTQWTVSITIGVAMTTIDENHVISRSIGSSIIDAARDAVASVSTSSALRRGRLALPARGRETVSDT
jgi:hypothetical protein